MSMAEMTKLFPNRTSHSISVKAQKMGFTSIYIKKNNVKYKAIYQNKDWLTSEILQGKNYKKLLTKNTYTEDSNNYTIAKQKKFKEIAKFNKSNRKQ